MKQRQQTIDFLGFLRSQLNGLQGIPTLCYELIQNADDVKDENGNPGAHRITFDVCDDALWVENDGVFREIDFERMQRIAWSNKREEAGTTGAFGIGFISVYQITDTPEIFSSGRHWVLHPEERGLIYEEELDTQFTRFRLSWAFDFSKVRKDLGVLPVTKEQVQHYPEEIAQIIENAAIFLKQIDLLEVKRNGELIRRIQVLRENDECILDDGKTTIFWRILRGDFSDAAQAMRERSGEQIEAKRRATVELAIPDEPLEHGLLYAFLPSETVTDLPFHINADFFPSPDRKHILLGTDYRAEWNRRALECARETLAHHVKELVDLFDIPKFWKFVSRTKDACERGPIANQLPDFWRSIRSEISKERVILSTRGERLRPPQAYYPPQKEVFDAAEALEDLELPIVHGDLHRYRNLLIDRSIGVPLLTLEHVADALLKKGLDKRTRLAAMPVHLQSIEGWERLWAAIDALWASRPPEALSRCALALGTDGSMYPPIQLLRTSDKAARTFFSQVAPVSWLSDNPPGKTRLNSLVPKLDLEQGLELLARCDLAQLLRNTALAPQSIFDWLAKYEESLKYRSTLVDKVKTLPIGPTPDGDFRPLSELFIAGDFEDPLHLTRLIDLAHLEGRKDFLIHVLGVRQLDFETYVSQWLPNALRSGQIKQEARISLIKFLAEHLGKLKGDDDLRQKLCTLPLILGEDGEFHPAGEVYFRSEEVEAVLGQDICFVALPEEGADAVQDLYEWLGVVRIPKPQDVLLRIYQLISSPPTKERIEAIEQLFEFLGSKWSSWEEETRQAYIGLRTREWLPGTRETDRWHQPDKLYTVFRAHLFKSQGNFLAIERAIQEKSADFIKFLGIKNNPEPPQVVRHLLFCAKGGQPVNTDVYQFLSNHVQEINVNTLKSHACLYLKVEDEESYVAPKQVFFREHPFGRFRIVLPETFNAYRPFLKRVSVKDVPDAEDALAVLQEIAQTRYAQSTLSVQDSPEQVKEVSIAAWKMLNEALERGEVTPDKIRAKVLHVRCIPNTQDLLTEPERLFFEDRPGWAAKFELIRDNIVPRIEDAWKAMDAAGVRRLSEVVTTEIAECEAPQDDSVVKRRLTERQKLLHRVIEGYRSKGIREFNLERLKELDYRRAKRIQVVRTLNAFGRIDRTGPEEVRAVCLDHVLHFVVLDGEYPWRDISRELSYILYEGEALNSLAMEIYNILSPPTVDEASEALDDFGYPPLDTFDQTATKTRTAQELGQHLDQEKDLPLASPEVMPQQSLPEEDAVSHSPSTSEPSEASCKKVPKRTSRRLVSYVIPENDQSRPPAQDHDRTSRLKEIGKLGEEIVMQFEHKQGREPERMEVHQPNHPGYDIKSIDPEDKGRTRIIEVKSLTGRWEGTNPVLVTKQEFETAREYGKLFWLYVVERVESDEPRIYCIQDPAGQIDLYAFDHGWIALDVCNTPKTGPHAE